MPDTDFLPARFTISENAKREIEVMRGAWNDNIHDPAEIAVIGWGIYIAHSGARHENVVVTFYGRSEVAPIAHAVQTVSGIPIVFFTTPHYARYFDGKVLDHSRDYGFFLRESLHFADR
ncbi:MAG: hypothetical protein K8H87_11145 [Pseudorhodoplanes sp.]|nr:hypothetical protein [Pseudorhodoplanes sp.]